MLGRLVYIYIFFLLRLLTPVHIFHIIQEIEGRGGLGRRLCASYAINRFETVFLRGAGVCRLAGVAQLLGTLK